MNEQQYLPLTQAALTLGIDRKRVRQLVARGELPPFIDPLDRRKTLIATADLERVRQPRPRSLPQQASTAA